MQLINSEKFVREKILESDSAFETKRLSFIPAWNIAPEQLSSQANDLEVASGIGHEFPYPYTIENAKWFLDYSKENWKSGREYNFAILDKTTKEFCGMIGFKLSGEVVSNIGYWLGREHWGKGLATETLKETVQYIKKNFTKVKQINASAYKYNLGSQNVIFKAGFEQVGERIASETLRNGQPDESFTYSLKI